MIKTALITCVLLFLASFGQSAQLAVPVAEMPNKVFAPLNLSQYQQLEEMLGELQLTPADLNFEKDWDLSTWGKSPLILKALQQPYQGLDLLNEVRESCAAVNTPEGLARSLDKLNIIAQGYPDCMGTYLYYYSFYSQLYAKEVKHPADLFRFYETALDGIVPVVKGVSAFLSEAEHKSIMAFMLGTFMEPEDKEQFTAYFTMHGIPTDDSTAVEDITKLLFKLKETQLSIAGMRYLALSQVIAKNAVLLGYSNKKPIIRMGKYGTMVIGSIKADVYQDKDFKQPVVFMLDPDGDDRYEMKLNTTDKNKCYFLADLKGNDSYLNDEMGGQFFARGGLGVSCDLGGNDVYRTGDFSFAAILGMAVHIDEQGSDLYQSGLFSQGAAMFGSSIMLDAEGNDSYRATSMAQGFGSIKGAGALLDLGGADTYDLGGKYTHAPLMPNDYLTMGQGMGFGSRPDFGGGLGLLFDAKGNDRYLGGVYAQGVGYWYAMGMLIDEGGNDVYNAVYYPQGSGIHLACGYLYDGGGDDAYYSRHGPGQGAGHDWGQGILIDESGNDAYSIQGGNGLGLSNSVGIFVDKSGDDRYERSEAQNYGSAAFSRSTGGIGLFLDGGGKDSYPDSTKADGLTWKKGTYGIGRDVAGSPEKQEADKEELVMTPPPAEDAPIADIFAAAAEWEVGNAVQRVKAAREIMLKRSAEAGEYVVSNKLTTNSGLEYRALEALTKGSPEFKTLLFSFVDDTDSLKAKNSMSLLAGEQDSTLIIPISKHLENKKYVTACLSLLGSIKTDESVKLLSRYAFHSSERYRYIVARSLRQIDTPNAIIALENMAGDSSFLVKTLIRKYREDKQ